MLNFQEQQMFQILQQKMNTPDPIPQPTYTPPAPVQQIQAPPMPDFSNLATLINTTIDNKLSALQPKTPVPEPVQQKAPEPMPKVQNHDDFINRLKPILIKSLTLPQSGKLFMLGLQAGENKEALFKDAILGFLATETGVSATQMIVDSFLAELDKATQQAQAQQK